MRKILMILSLICLCVGSVCGQSLKFKDAPTTVALNDVTEFTVHLLNASPLKAYQVSIRATGGTPDRTTIPIGMGINISSFKVRWTQITNTAKVEVVLRNVPENTPIGSAVSTPNIKVLKDNTEDPSQKMSISGPSELYVLEPGTYNLINHQFSISNSAKWVEESNLCRVKEEWDYISGYSAIVTPIMSSDSEKTRLRCTAGDSSTGLNAIFYKTIIIKKPKITSNSINIQNNEEVTYTLKDYYPSAQIVWQAGNNMTLVSGQGTSTATFKASGLFFDAYGYATGVVKATISNNGINYAAENSDVQIKRNATTGSITYTARNNNTLLDPKDNVGSLTFGGDIKGATSFEWGGGFPPQYKGSKTSSTVIVDKKHIILAKGMYIYVIASNARESVQIFYNVATDGEVKPRD